MRKVIALQVEKPKLNPEQIKQHIAQIIELFDGYLDEYPVKSARSKHAVMGPVAKILERAQAGQWDAEPLTGYALRMHEMNPRARGRITQTAVSKLREATEQLLSLCQSVPITALANTVEQIDYGLYFQRRLKGMAWLEEQRKALVEFLKNKYESDQAFVKAWGLKPKKGQAMRVVDQYYFGQTSKTYVNGNATLQADMDTFYQVMAEQGENPDAILEEDTEE
jgi:hypothetical protein